MLPAIEELVPHRGRMLLLDALLGFEGERCECGLTVRDDPLFCRDGEVGAWVGVEYMAQSVAALIGLKARAAGGPVKIGLLLGTRRYQAHVPAFVPGMQLRVSATELFHADNGVGAFEARVYEGERLLAEASLTAFQPDDVARFLEDGQV